MILVKALPWLTLFAAMAAPLPAAAQPSPSPGQQSGDFVLQDFRFHSGEVMALRQHYTTLGNPKGEAVLILHGTGGNGAGMIAGFRPLFAAGAPLDTASHFIILPDAIGHGASSKPSDGMKAKFPRYNYDDMAQAQYRLLTEGLGVKHLRLVIGNSMGGMETWVWGVKYPAMMDAIVPLASQPTAMAARNWMMRKLVIETIKADPDYHDGNYTSQPKLTRYANAFYATGTNGGDLGWQGQAPTRAKADALVDKALKASPPADTNDFIYQWQSSADYDVSPNLGRIKARVLAINSADDERNPVASGLMASSIKQIKRARLYLIPASADTRGHGTTGSLAQLWAPELAKFMARLPKH